MAILNALLQPMDAPITSERGTIGYQWDTTTDRGMIRSVQIQNASIGSAQIGTAAIGSANIRDFSFNQGQGGTITLGGTANGNGVLNVNDAGGTTKVVLDNTGITVNDGKMTLKDANGTTIMDSTGLISLANFSSGGTTAGNFDTTSTSYVDVTGASLTIVLTNEARVLYMYSFIGSGQSPNGGDDAIMVLNVDGTVVGPILVNSGYEWSSGVTFNSAAATHIDTHAAGTFTAKLQGKSNAGNNANINSPTLNYVVLGK
jgi:hypothetical protein